MCFRAAENAMIEVIVQGGDQELRIRKAPGSSDISGDFTAYEWTQTVEPTAPPWSCAEMATAPGLPFGPGTGYTFSITNNADLTPEAMTAMAESVA